PHLTPPHPRSTLFPYTTLFRSALAVELILPGRPIVRLLGSVEAREQAVEIGGRLERRIEQKRGVRVVNDVVLEVEVLLDRVAHQDRKSTRLNSSHVSISYAVFC